MLAKICKEREGICIYFLGFREINYHYFFYVVENINWKTANIMQFKTKPQ